MSTAFDSGVLCSSDAKKGGGEYDTMDHRTVLGGRHCGNNVHSGIDMAGVGGVTCNESEKGGLSMNVIVCEGRIVAWQLTRFSLTGHFIPVNRWNSRISFQECEPARVLLSISITKFTRSCFVQSPLRSSSSTSAASSYMLEMVASARAPYPSDMRYRHIVGTSPRTDL